LLTFVSTISISKGLENLVPILPTIVSYNASAAKIYSAMKSTAAFLEKNIFFLL
jgi:hypothetical protein